MITLYDINGHEILHHDLQDKSHWCKDGEGMEQSFIRQYGAMLGYEINPEKETDVYAPDILDVQNHIPGDLKVQHTPFFKAEVLYGIDPTYAVVFNVKDKIRYEKNYPDIDIIYWINWIAVKARIRNRLYYVTPFKGVFRTRFRQLVTYLPTRKVHYYQQRVDDSLGNAKGSYVLDINDDIFEKLAD